MAKNLYIICLGIGLLIKSFSATGADTLTLAESYQLAEKNFPILRQQMLYDEAFALRIRNLQTNFLPGLALNGQASYQSEVVELPFSQPNMERLELPHERWQVSLDLNQTIYDGGTTRAHKAVEKDQLQIDQQQVLVDVQQLKKQVNQVYLSVLLAEQSKAILQSTLQLLEEKVKTLQAGVQGGVVLESEVLKVEAEMLRLQQQIRESQEKAKAARTSLGILTGTEITDTQPLAMPADVSIDLQENLYRPELEMFDFQQRKLATHTQLVEAKTLPKVSAFAQGGYGYPNPFNFFDASVSPFYMVGAKVSWNFWNWHSSRREKEVLAVQSEVLQTGKENLERNIQLNLEQQLADITRLQAAITDDEEIVRIQEKIRQLSSAQLDHGVITSTEYVDAVNAEQQARLQLEWHTLQLTQAKINYVTEKGTF